MEVKRGAAGKQGQQPRHHHARPVQAQQAPTAQAAVERPTRPKPEPVAPVLVAERSAPARHSSVRQETDTQTEHAKPEPQHAADNEIRKPAELEHLQAAQEQDQPEPQDSPQPQDQANQGD